MSATVRLKVDRMLSRAHKCMSGASPYIKGIIFSRYAISETMTSKTSELALQLREKGYIYMYDDCTIPLWVLKPFAR